MEWTTDSNIKGSSPKRCTFGYKHSESSSWRFEFGLRSMAKSKPMGRATYRNLESGSTKCCAFGSEFNWSSLWLFKLVCRSVAK